MNACTIDNCKLFFYKTQCCYLLVCGHVNPLSHLGERALPQGAAQNVAAHAFLPFILQHQTINNAKLQLLSLLQIATRRTQYFRLSTGKQCLNYKQTTQKFAAASPQTRLREKAPQISQGSDQRHPPAPSQHALASSPAVEDPVTTVTVTDFVPAASNYRRRAQGRFRHFTLHASVVRSSW